MCSLTHHLASMTISARAQTKLLTPQTLKRSLHQDQPSGLARWSHASQPCSSRRARHASSPFLPRSARALLTFPDIRGSSGDIEEDMQRGGTTKSVLLFRSAHPDAGYKWRMSSITRSRHERVHERRERERPRYPTRAPSDTLAPLLSPFRRSH